MPPCLILINGYPGVGKYTIAKLLHNALGSNSTFIHNHLLIDPVEAIYPGRTPAHYALRKQFRDVTFDALIKDPNPQLSILITISLAANNDDIDVMHEHLKIARERLIAVYWINLTCNDDEHKTRMVSDERKYGGTSKCTDPTVLDEIKTTEGAALLTIGDVTDAIQSLTVEFLQLDTSGKLPKECADIIQEWIWGRLVLSMEFHSVENFTWTPFEVDSVHRICQGVCRNWTRTM